MTQPNNIVSMDADTFQMYVRIQNTRMKLALGERYKNVSDILIQSSLECVHTTTGILLTKERWMAIFFLFPILNSVVKMYGFPDSDSESAVVNMISQFYLSVDWPRNRDQVDSSAFLARLHLAATTMGETINSSFQE